MKGFKNVRAYIYGKGIITCDISFEDGIITQIGENLPIDEVIECNGLVLPGFVDRHIHGAGGADGMDGEQATLQTIADNIVKEGTTTFLATTMTQSEENIIKAMNSVRDYVYTSGAKVAGIHLEGPFISPKFKGAQPEQYIKTPNSELMDRFFVESGGKIKVVSLAPEQENAEELIKYLKGKNVVASVGHSQATFEQVEKSIGWGVNSVTHTFNAQTPLHHREAGVVGAAMMKDELYTEIICDLIHACKQAVGLLVKNKPKDKVIMITDSMRAKHLPDGESELGGQKVIVKDGQARLSDGTLAGSVLKMNVALKNMVEQVGVKLEDAINFATANPAKSLGLFDSIGSIAVGKCADFVVLDKDYNVLTTIVKGNVAYKS